MVVVLLGDVLTGSNHVAHLLLGNLGSVDCGEELHDLVEDHLRDEVDLSLVHGHGLVGGGLAGSGGEFADMLGVALGGNGLQLGAVK